VATNDPLPLALEPRDLLLGTDNDLVIRNGDLVFSRGIEAVRQGCRIALLMFQGEWFANLLAGIPYYNGILGEKPTKAIAAARVAFRRELLSVPGVLEVLRLEVTFEGNTRTMSMNWQVRTALGDTPAELLPLGGAATGGST